VAEEAYRIRLAIHPGSPAPVYVIGSEVPIPGGAQAPEESITVTSPENCKDTFETFRSVFSKFGLESVFPRFIAIVVQPGVEFGDAEVFQYDTEAANELIQYGKKHLPIVYEGHSTDYQTKDSLKAMVQDGIAILKVGPALTFALREALFALEMIEKELYIGKSFKASNFRDVLEMAMLNHPDYWKNHYHGDAFQLHFARKFSYSDRARYYMPVPEVENAIHQLIKNIDNKQAPASLIRQYMPAEYQALFRGSNHVSAEDLILEHIGLYLDDYYYAIR
jgi:D-tagatose-1,6-bisphosphate aldolase subunit GatZ/KbaZ